MANNPLLIADGDLSKGRFVRKNIVQITKFNNHGIILKNSW